MNAPSTANSGIESIDNDYASFQILLEPEKLELLRELAGKEVVGTGDLFKVADQGAFRFARALLGQEAFEKLKRLVSADFVPELYKAKEKAQSSLEPILASEKLRPLVLGYFEPDEQDGVSLAPLALDTITSVSVFPSWLISGSNVHPLLRLLLGTKDKLLLDSTLDWDDAYFIARTLLREVANDMDRVRSLIQPDKRNILDETAIEKIVENVGAMKADLDRAVDAVSKLLEEQKPH